jgi:two-component system nitrogen regulation response regulator GlnG
MSLAQILPQHAGGTVLVEELAGLSLSHQSRLLAALQSELPTGEPAVRMILSTSIPSRLLLDKGLLRSDLYYFLSPYAVRVPALRERGEDFELLVAHFMQQLTRVAATNENQGPPRVSSAALDLLRQHDWPGNLAQLKSVLQSVLLESHGAVLASATLCRALDRGPRRTLPCPAAPALSGEAAPAEVPLNSERRPDGVNSPWNLTAFVRERLRDGTDRLYADSVAELEQSLLALVLQHTRGNQAQAAKHLGITRTSLRKKIALANIDLTRIEHQADSRS